jgi:sugar lactone lactonase YvrE/dienelactone hydrolase
MAWGALLIMTALVCQAAWAVPARAQVPQAAPETLSALFADDARTPPAIKVVGTEARDGVTVEDITFEGSGGATVEAYLVRPSEGRGAFAGVLFVHWFSPRHHNSNRTQYLEEARALARRGTVSLLVSTFWSDPARYRARRWQDDFQNTVNQARDLRRALDVLVSRPGVDAARVGFVGHDYGAMFGALLSGADARPKAYALIAGAARFPDWYLFGSSSGVPVGADLENFRKRFATLDPVSAVRQAKAAFLFQYGEDDRFTPRENFVELYLAAPAPKRLATYASDHPMDAEAIRRDRTEWLAERLGLAPAATTQAAAAQTPTEQNWLRYFGRGAAALRQKDYAAYLENFREAARINPRHPEVVYNLARAHALAGERAEAAAWLGKFIRMGLGHDPADDEAFAALKDSAEWRALAAELEKTRAPVANSRAAFTLAEKDLVAEGIAHDPVGRVFYVGSIHRRKVVSVDARGVVKDFTGEGQDGLWGVLGLRVDPARGVLWVNSVAGPEAGEARGSSGVFKYDLKTGKLIKKYLLTNKPRTHLLNDVALNARGDAFITDSEEGSVYAVRASRDELERLVAPGTFIYPNGVTLSPDERRLYVADFASGLSVVDVESGAVKAVEYPEGVIVHGADGLYFYRDSLVAVQNLRGPGCVVRLFLNKEGDRVERERVVESFNPLFEIPTTGVLVGDELFYIANSQLRKLNDAGVIPAGTALNEVRILRAAVRGRASLPRHHLLSSGRAASVRRPRLRAPSLARRARLRQEDTLTS